MTLLCPPKATSWPLFCAITQKWRLWSYLIFSHILNQWHWSWGMIVEIVWSEWTHTRNLTYSISQTLSSLLSCYWYWNWPSGDCCWTMWQNVSHWKYSLWWYNILVTSIPHKEQIKFLQFPTYIVRVWSDMDLRCNMTGRCRHLTSLHSALTLSTQLLSFYSTLIHSRLQPPSVLLLSFTQSSCLFGRACFPCSARFPLICGGAFGFDHSHNERERLDALMPL